MVGPEHFLFPLNSLDNNYTQKNCTITVNTCKVNPPGEMGRCLYVQE